MDKVGLSPDALAQVSLTNARLKETGMLGKIFGTKEHAPTNVAGAAVVLFAIGSMAAIATGASSEAIGTIVSLFTLSFGYFAGKGHAA